MDYEKYDSLCSLMTSRETLDYQAIPEEIVHMFYLKGVETIEKMFQGEVGCEEQPYEIDLFGLFCGLEEIYTGEKLANRPPDFTGNSIKDNINDPDHIGLINTFAYQFTILISQPFQPSYFEYDWKDYNAVKYFLRNTDNSIKNLIGYEEMPADKPIFFL